MHRGYLHGPFSNSFGMSSWMIIIPIVLIGLIAIAAYMIFKNNKGSINQHKDTTALDILDERYAKGEIDEQEYKKRKKILTDNH